MKRLALVALLVLAGCARTPPPPIAQPRYVVGEPYQMGGVWSYPREDFQLSQTGLAAVIADQRSGRRTANGEIHDPTALVAAHRTLQMPAVVTVTNLENGLQLQVRVNDRGPVNPGRVIDLSRRAAELLGIRPGATAQVRVEVVGEQSRGISAALPNTETPTLQIAAAPVAAVEREDLAPPPGAAQAARVREARRLPGDGRAGVAEQAAVSAAPERLPERLTRVAAMPGRLYVEGATFSRRDMAERQAARLAGLRPVVEAQGPRGRQTFRVRLGPFNSVPEADRALEGSLRAGVSEARILVD